MKILALSGSPRGSRGLTEVVLTRFLDGARDAGADVTTVQLHRRDIRPCRGCFACWIRTPGECSQRDGMRDLLSLFMESDLVVPATPVYHDNMTSILKSFFERTMPILNPHFVAKEGRILHERRGGGPRRLFLVGTCGKPTFDTFDPLVMTTRRICEDLHLEYAGHLLRPASSTLMAMREFRESVSRILRHVEQAGREVVLDGAVSQSTLDGAHEVVISPSEFVEWANARWDSTIRRHVGQEAEDDIKQVSRGA